MLLNRFLSSSVTVSNSILAFGTQMIPNYSLMNYFKNIVSYLNMLLLNGFAFFNEFPSISLISNLNSFVGSISIHHSDGYSFLSGCLSSSLTSYL